MPASAGAARARRSAHSTATKSPTCAPFRLLCVLPTAPGAESLAKIVGCRGRGANAVARRLLDALPRRTVEHEQLLEAEGTRQPGRAVRRHQRRLGDDRAAAAHRIEQCRSRRPRGKREQAGSQIFAQRRLLGVAPIAALEQRLSGRVDVDRRVAIGQVGVDPHVRRALVDRRPHVEVGAQPVAHGILDAQRGEFEALQRRTRRGDVDAQRARGEEQALPVDRMNQRIDVRLVAIAAGGDAPQDAAGDARFEIGAVNEVPIALEADAAIGWRYGGAAQRGELGGEHAFQSARAGGEEVLGHPEPTSAIAAA